MVFRVNFLAFWLLCNTLFAGLIENMASNEKTSTKMIDGSEHVVANCGETNFLLIFAMYLASLVLYKVFFGALSLLHFKLMSTCQTKYKVYSLDLDQEVKRLRAETRDWDKSLLESGMGGIGIDDIAGAGEEANGGLADHGGRLEDRDDDELLLV